MGDELAQLKSHFDQGLLTEGQYQSCVDKAVAKYAHPPPQDPPIAPHTKHHVHLPEHTSLNFPLLLLPLPLTPPPPDTTAQASQSPHAAQNPVPNPALSAPTLTTVARLLHARQAHHVAQAHPPHQAATATSPIQQRGARVGTTADGATTTEGMVERGTKVVRVATA